MRAPIFVAALALLAGAACRPTSPSGGVMATSASSKQPAVDPPARSPDAPDPAAATAGCDKLPADHNALFRRGVELSDPYMVLHDVNPAEDLHKSANLRAAIGCFDRALQLEPERWATLWLRAKAYQALGDHRSALASFRSAFDLHPQNPDVGRELAMEYIQTGQFSEAVVVARAASQASPSDAGLLANLALALLLDGKIQESLRAIEAARQADPEDAITKALEQRIREVASGKRPRPRTLQELERP